METVICEEEKSDEKKLKRKRAQLIPQLSLSLSSPSMKGCAVTKRTSCLDYQLLCHFLMRLYAQSGGGANTLQKIGLPIFNHLTPPFIQQTFRFTLKQTMKKVRLLGKSSRETSGVDDPSLITDTKLH